MRAKYSPLILTLLLTLLLPLQGATAAEPEREQVIMVLDASGSMWGQIKGRTKIDISRQVIDGLLNDWDPKVDLGIMTYGHRRKGDCNDIEMIVPISQVNPDSAMSILNKLNPKGKTPLSAAVKQAAEALRYTEERATVILISDGRETCNMNPCELGSTLEQGGVDFTTHVIGFDISDERDRAQLECLANNTGGEYFSARGAAGLHDAMEKTVAIVTQAEPKPKPEPVPEPKPKPKPEVKPQPVPEPPAEPKAEGPTGLQLYATLSEGGTTLARDVRFIVYQAKSDDSKGKRLHDANGTPFFDLKPGQYVVEAHYDLARASDTIEVKSDGTTNHTLVLSAGHLKPSATLSEGSQRLERDVTFTIYKIDSRGNRQRVDYRSGQPVWHIDAGNYLLKAQYDLATAEIEVRIVPGEGNEPVINLNAGLLKPAATLSESSQPLERDVTFTIYQQDTKGNRQRVDYRSGKPVWHIGAGKYLLKAQYDLASAETEIEITPNQGTEPMINLNAGYLKPAALLNEGAQPIERDVTFTIYQQDAKGNRQRVDYRSGKPVWHIGSGKYLLKAQYDLASTETEIEITPNQGTEPLLNLNASYLRPAATLNAGGKPIERDVTFTIYDLKTDIYGNRQRIDYRHHKPVWHIGVGNYLLKAQYDLASAETEIEIKPGVGADPVINLQSGYLRPTAVLSAAGKPIERDVTFTIYDPKVDLHGNRQRIDYRHHKPVWHIGAGNYRLKAQYDLATAEIEIEIKPGTGTEPKIDLDAGYLKPSAKLKDGTVIDSGVTFSLYESGQDLHGNRQRIDYRHNKPLWHLNSGQYLLRATSEGGSSESTIEIKPGKGAEPVMELEPKAQ